MATRQAMGHYLLGAFGLSVLGLSIFVFVPTAVPDLEWDWSNYPSLLFLKQSDASGNACPSLHVGFAVYAGLWLNIILPNLPLSRFWQGANLLWCNAIVFSTLTTKQHVLIDVICGAFLAALFFAGNSGWLSRNKTNL